MSRYPTRPMVDVARCSSCGIRTGNRLTTVREYPEGLICDMCVREAYRGATMVEDPEYLRPPGVIRRQAIGQ